MNSNDENINVPRANNSNKETNELDRINRVSEGEATEGDITRLQDDIVRNDTIPESSKDTPGSSGAFPVGAFDTSKD